MKADFVVFVKFLKIIYNIETKTHPRPCSETDITTFEAVSGGSIPPEGTSKEKPKS